MRLSPRVTVLITASLIALRCGDNIESAGNGGLFGPPQNVRAASVNISSIRVEWSPATTSSDSTFQGYIIVWGSNADTVSKTTFSFAIDSLNQGEVLVTLYSLLSTGQISNPATVRWAPAARFDSAFVVYERNASQPPRQDGLNVGTSTTNPSTMIVNPSVPVVSQTLDLYFYGGQGQIRDSLAMWSASLLVGTFNPTRFSTVTHTATSLDHSVAAFPDPGTFTKDSIAVADNTIYYARVIGEPQQVNYCRIHLHVQPGTTFPNRIIEVRISLQRLPGLLYAESTRTPPRIMRPVGLIMNGGTCY